MLDEATAARESGFGTGLLAHLERWRTPDARAEAPQPDPPPVPREPEPPAAPPEPYLDRERLLAEREAALEAARAELAAREAQLATRHSPSADASLPEHLRVHAEAAADRVWSAFGDALGATHADGRPDHALRIAAAQALLAELRLDPPGAAFADELARRRELRGAVR